MTATTQHWQPDIVIYHHPCADGFGAAWAIHRRWPDALFIPAAYGDIPPPVNNKRVLIVDFSYTRDTLIGMACEAHSVVILDHHKTAHADLESFTRPQHDLHTFAHLIKTAPHLFDSEEPEQRIFAFFDMERSGARLAWEFAHPTDHAPMLINYIEDRDLWRFELPESKAFALYLRQKPMTFAAWGMVQDSLEDNKHDIMSLAYAMQTYHDSLVAGMVANARTGYIAGYAAPCVNCPSVLASDVGNALLLAHPDAPFAACYSDGPDGYRNFSLRSENGRHDVSDIAKSRGGGGHRNAAGFRQPSPVVAL